MGWSHFEVWCFRICKENVRFACFALFLRSVAYTISCRLEEMWDGKTTRKLNIDVKSIVLYALSSELFPWLFAMIRTKNNAFLHGRHRKKHNGSPHDLSNFLYLLLWRSNTHIKSLMSLPFIGHIVKTHLLDSFLTFPSLLSRFSLVIPRPLPSTQQLLYAPFLLPIGKLLQARKTICDQEWSLKDKVVENCDCAFNADAGFASFDGCSEGWSWTGRGFFCFDDCSCVGFDE